MNTDKKREKLLSRRKQRAICRELNLDNIRYFLDRMQEDAYDVAYANQDEDILEDILGEEDAYSFRMAFSALETDAEKFAEDLDDKWVPEDFDDIMVGFQGQSEMGWFDEADCDYYGFEQDWEADAAIKDAQNRLNRHTKPELLDAYGQCFRIAICYMALKTRYDNLQDVLDIIRDHNEGIMQITQQVDKLYTKVATDAPEYDDIREWNRLLSNLPQECWIR